MITAIAVIAIQFLNNEKDLKINQYQVIGSHNSYKKKIQPELFDMIKSQDEKLASTIDYSHVSITKQLELGLRVLELDVVYDPKGGRYANPVGNMLLQQAGVKPKAYNNDGKMDKPGFKVLHIQDIDFRTHCLKFKDGLKQIKEWSDKNPEHYPIVITINAKTDKIDRPGFTEPLPFDKKAFSDLEKEILSVYSKSRIITPDAVRGEFETLEKAVLAKNWPSKKDAEGKIMFVLDEGGKKRDTYTTGHPSLKDRVMFVKSLPGTPESAFIILNDPINDGELIKKYVDMGYLVRTRADADTKEARAEDYTRFKAALKSGAQFISTDYYIPVNKFNTNYYIQMPDGKMIRERL